MKLATTTGDFNSYTHHQAESLRLIREAGFAYADYSFGLDFDQRSGIYAPDSHSYIQSINQTASDIGIQLVQAHAPMGRPLAEDGGVFISDTIACVKACGEWGIPHLVVHSGYKMGLSREQTFEANKTFFTPILQAAEAYGVNILVENFNKMCIDGLYWIDNATDLRGLIDYIDHPLCHAVWDAGHANMQEMPQDEELAILGHHVKALHIQDNMGDRDAHLLPFLGTMNLDAVMNGLKNIGYDGYFTFEVGGIFTPSSVRRPYPTDTRLATPPLALKLAAEKYLYATGKCILEAYGCFEG